MLAPPSLLLCSLAALGSEVLEAGLLLDEKCLSLSQQSNKVLPSHLAVMLDATEPIWWLEPHFKRQT